MTKKRNEIKSFADAFRGIGILFRRERHAQIHLVVAIAVVFAGFYFSITDIQWLVIALTIAMVFTAEGLNTAIEKLSDAVHPERSEKIRDVKDIAAGAVLISCIIAVIIGCCIFIPYL
ncbi:MAG TPA: diacylglycerol kinase family protein [Chitinophagales bacterium]|nr:diacylglycerol kinase family protein [Chitinophagales bacterium]HNJ89305.1 diacylglycerol kinase family protein [Chitinophagales bacterium]HNK97200.1 diacylglycerol kinase family protein [Chitinophagales bacterium]HNM07069.1 diacylglycerol kinase family protein [Chitinophagales bacterium]HNM28940.1 diacylglycerol kinase family protein [Chitinophagales bacterium]